MSSITAWKSFIEGRIAIERGDFQTGLDLIKKANDLSPGEETFCRSLTIAQELASKSKVDILVKQVSNEYEQLAKRNVGSFDTAQDWIGNLETMLEQLEKSGQEERFAIQNSAVLW